jgi:histone H3/H4
MHKSKRVIRRGFKKVLRLQFSSHTASIYMLLYDKIFEYITKKARSIAANEKRSIANYKDVLDALILLY